MKSKSNARGKVAPRATTIGNGIWEKPRIQAMLKQPLGSPVDLTRREAIAVARAAFGKRPDLPPGKEYVRHLKPIWKSLLKDRNG